MNPTQLLAHFDRISEAPDAVTRLRRFILDLAVRGKLVKQDPSDEPAAELLKRIQAEKAHSIKDGTSKKEKPLPKIELDELPFSAPHAWEWVRIRQVTGERGQTKPDKDFTYIDVTAINKETGCIADPTVVTSAEAPSRARKVVCTGDVLFSCVRPYLLNIAIVDKTIVPTPIASTAFAVLNGFGLVLSRYQWIVLRSPFMVECVESKMRGQAYPAINDSDFAILLFPLPPLAEQHRIVAKVDELMALCDELAAAQNEREARRDRLVAASLNHIGTAPAAAAETVTENQTATSLHDAARFYLNHLPRLTTRPEHIKALRQTFFKLAVCGLLIEQNPNDEAIGVPLKRLGMCAANSELLLKPSSIPSTWEWMTIDQIADVSSGTTPSRDVPEYYVPIGTPWVTSGETRNAFITQTDQHVSNLALKETSLKLYPPGTLIVAMYGQGKTRGQVAELSIPATTNQACAAIVLKLKNIEHRRYVKLYFQKIYAEIRELAAGGAQPNLNGGKIKSTLIPLPPLAEQQRIVARVDELMALCDQLETQLTTTQTDSRRLLEAVLRDALETGAVATG